MRIYRCIKTVTMQQGKLGEYIAFTEGEIYTGHRSNEPDGTPAIEFINDLKEKHLANGRWLRKHFEFLEEADVSEIGD